MKLEDVNIPIYFVSPHLDDAVFSAGGMISSLSKKGYDVTVINVFTSPGDNIANTLSSKAYLKQCGYKSAQDLYVDRIKEDSASISKLKNVKIINLGLIDALWRTKNNPKLFEKIMGKLIPEFIRIYPTYRWNIQSGAVSRLDNKLISTLTLKLEFLIPPHATIFYPRGIGKHVDHLIVKRACENLSCHKIMWLDFPYYLNYETQKALVESENLKQYEFSEELQTKSSLMSGYVSQLVPIFGDTGPVVKPDILYEVKTIK